jgi:lysophospholipase L1-like esterase
VTGPNTYTITATAGSNGSINPSGAVVVNAGDSQSFTITPDAGYQVQDVLVDNVSVGAVTTYTFPVVGANHTIEASFAVALGTIIDNMDSTNFSTVGDWSHSSFFTWFYGIDYQYATAGDGLKIATWESTIPSTGLYEISAWWVSNVDRTPDAKYTIYNNGLERETIIVDQRLPGGRFISLGTFQLMSGSVEIVLANDVSGGVVIADAIRITNVGSTGNLAPNGLIDTPSTGILINVGDSLDFNGSGNDLDGNNPLSYLWSFGDQAISDSTSQNPGPVQFNKPGSFKVRMTATDALGLSDPTPATATVHVRMVSDNVEAVFTPSTVSWPSSSYYPSYFGSNYQYSTAGIGLKTASWSFNLPVGGLYDVSAWWISGSDRALGAPYTIYNNSIEIVTYTANQQINGGQFNLLGTHAFESGSVEVVLSDNVSSGIVTADAIELLGRCSAMPSVSLLHPKNGHLQPSPDLNIVAAACLDESVHGGWRMKFIVDGSAEFIDNEYPFELNLTGLSQSEHIIDAFLINATGEVVAGTETCDSELDTCAQVTNIGIGNYDVAIGDSITEGVGDDYLSDNESSDGRNGIGGFTPILSDLLTNAANIPHIVYNEGVGGTKSSYWVNKIDAVLAKHPHAQRFLIEIGTNDANGPFPLPPGPGPGSFQDNLQQIINAVNTARKKVVLAKAPIVLGDGETTYADPANPPAGSRGDLVIQYNEIVQDLKDDPANNITIAPPDLWSLFNEDVAGSKRYEFEYFDNLHPNGTGYQSVADLWLLHLAP